MTEYYVTSRRIILTEYRVLAESPTEASRKVKAGEAGTTRIVKDSETISAQWPVAERTLP